MPDSGQKKIDEPNNNSVVTGSSGTLNEVVRLSVPLVIAYLSFSMKSLVDTLIMGRVGTPEQGAVGLGGMVAWMLGSLFVGTFTVISVFVARDYGAGKLDRLRKMVHAGLYLVAPFTALTWLMLPQLDLAFGFFGTSPEVSAHAHTYIMIRYIGFPFLLINFTMISFLRGIGNMRYQMYTTIIANIINIPISIILVFGFFGLPAMGVAGAALGTVFTVITEVALYAGKYFSPSYNKLYFTRSWLSPSAKDVFQFLKIGVPIGMMWLADMLIWSAFSVYASVFEPAALAAHMIVFQVMHLSFLPTAAISHIGTTLVGQYLGARRPDIAQRSALKVIGLGVGYMALAGLAMMVFRKPLIIFFNPDPVVIAFGVKIMILAGIYQPFDGALMSIAGVLRGGGDTRFTMIVLLVTSVTVFLPGVYILSERMGYGIIGAWGAVNIYGLVFTTAHIVRYLGGKWKTMKVQDD